MDGWTGQADRDGLTVAILHGSSSVHAADGYPSAVTDALEPLLEVHRAVRPVRVIGVSARVLGDAAAWSAIAEGSAGILVVPRDEEVRAFPWHPREGPFARSPDGRPVPVGWLAPSMLQVAGVTAARVAARHGARVGPIVLLGSGRPRSAAALDSIEAEWSRLSHEPPPHRWSSDRVGWEGLRVGLRSGLGCVVYMGHATADAWPAYGGVTAERLADAVVGRVPIPAGLGGSCGDRDHGSSGRPIRTLLALTCNGAGMGAPGLAAAASIPPDPASFACRVVTLGAAAGVLAAVGLVDHPVNRHLSGATVAALAAGGGTLADIVAHAAGDARLAGCLGSFRIIGDPLAPLAGDEGSWAQISEVPATVPGLRLPASDAIWPSRVMAR